MDLNDLLATTRAEFLSAFLEAAQKTIPKCIEDLFKKADVSYSSSEQGRLLNARSVLQDQGTSLTFQLSKNMESLLTRSFQTTYNTFRPNTALSFSADSLSLVDASAFEDELRIDDITKRFRSEAEEQLRDLGIRIALIFQQDVTTERENPFRPYMFSRCIATSVEGFGLSQDLTKTLVEQFSENFTSSVPLIYDRVNSHLAKHGIAAQLQLKIKKSPTQAGHEDQSGFEESDAEYDEVDQPFRNSQMRSPQSSHHGSHQNLGHNLDRQIPAQRMPVPITPKNQVEQLFESVRGMASGLVGRRSGSSQGAQNIERGNQDFSQSSQTSPYGQPNASELGGGAQSGGSAQSPKQFAWLGGGQAVGGVLRKFFGGGASDSASGSSGYAGGSADESTFDGQSDAASGGAAGAGGAANNGQPGAEVGASVGGTMRPGSAQIASAVHGMQKSYTPATADMLDSHGAVRNLILEQRAALNEMTQDIDEQMTIDIVAMLFEFILRDNQVPAEVRAQLGRLQFMVLKVALRDTSLLTQKGHPARMLVNRIGSISLGLKQLDPSGAHITAEICRIVETLLQDDNENPQLFSRMLDEFDAFIARELRANDKNIERTVELVEQAQNQTLRFAHTSAQMGEALLGLTIDRYLQDFLENTWVHVIEMADRTDEKRARSYRLLVPDLLWSIVPKLKEDDRTQLFALLPIILTTLREGLASIDFDSTQQQELLNWLVDAHTSGLRASHSATLASVPSLSAIHEHFNGFIHNPESKMSVNGEDESRTESQKYLHRAIQDLDIKVQMLDEVFHQELPPETLDLSSQAKQDDLSPQNIQERLRSGVALEINLGGVPSQGTLNWVDPTLTNLVLSLTGQSEPSIVSVRMFRRMIAHGRVRFLESEPLFERAVQSLLKSADNLDAVAIA